MNGRADGFTLVELMISTALLAIFSAIALGLGTQVREEHRLVTGYQRDLGDCRRALRTLEWDLRRATKLLSGEAGVFDLHDGDGLIRYELRDGGTWSRTRNGVTSVLARCLANVEVSADRGGTLPLARIALTLRRRAGVGTRARKHLSSCVAMRNAGGR